MSLRCLQITCLQGLLGRRENSHTTSLFLAAIIPSLVQIIASNSCYLSPLPNRTVDFVHEASQAASSFNLELDELACRRAAFAALFISIYNF